MEDLLIWAHFLWTFVFVLQRCSGLLVLCSAGPLVSLSCGCLLRWSPSPIVCWSPCLPLLFMSLKLYLTFVIASGGAYLHHSVCKRLGLQPKTRIGGFATPRLGSFAKLHMLGHAFLQWRGHAGHVGPFILGCPPPPHLHQVSHPDHFCASGGGRLRHSLCKRLRPQSKT